MKQPQMKDFGYIEPTLYGEGGWSLEGGEEAYHKALSEFRSSNQLGEGNPELAQTRYDAAKEWFARQRFGGGLEEIYTNIDKALRIAAGLEKVEA